MRAILVLSLFCFACGSNDPAPEPARLADAIAESVCFELRAHAGTTPDDTTPYELTPGERTETFYFDVPYDQEVQAISFEPLVEHPEVVKRIFLYDQSREPQPAGSHQFEITHLNTELLYAWASGLETYELPLDVGARLPQPGGSFAIELHHYNTGRDSVLDRSGLRVCTTSTPREHEAALIMLGTEDIALTETQTTAAGQCSVSPQQGEAAALVSVLPHMHFAGRRAKLAIADGGDNNKSRTLFDETFDFASHRFIETLVPLRAGDVIRSECTYDVKRDQPVARGEGLDMEECYFFAYTYPIEAWSERTFAFQSISNACLGAINP